MAIVDRLLFIVIQRRRRVISVVVRVFGLREVSVVFRTGVAPPCNFVQDLLVGPAVFRIESLPEVDVLVLHGCLRSCVSFWV